MAACLRIVQTISLGHKAYSRFWRATSLDLWAFALVGRVGHVGVPLLHLIFLSLEVLGWDHVGASDAGRLV